MPSSFQHFFKNCRLIGVLKHKYSVLNGSIPIKSITDKDNERASIDKLVRACCALANLCPSVISQD